MQLSELRHLLIVLVIMIVFQGNATSGKYTIRNYYLQRTHVLLEQTLFSNYHNLLIFVGLDGYTPEKDMFCFQDPQTVDGHRMDARNLTSAKQECSANTDCLMITDLCGNGDEFYWCRAGGVRKPSKCNSILYLKNN